MNAAQHRKLRLEELQREFLKRVAEGKSSDGPHREMVRLNVIQLRSETRQDKRKQRSA